MCARVCSCTFLSRPPVLLCKHADGFIDTDINFRADLGESTYIHTVIFYCSLLGTHQFYVDELIHTACKKCLLSNCTLQNAKIKRLFCSVCVSGSYQL